MTIMNIVLTLKGKWILKYKYLNIASFKRMILWIRIQFHGTLLCTVSARLWVHSIQHKKKKELFEIHAVNYGLEDCEIKLEH